MTTEQQMLEAVKKAMQACDGDFPMETDSYAPYAKAAIDALGPFVREMVGALLDSSRVMSNMHVKMSRGSAVSLELRLFDLERQGISNGKALASLPDCWKGEK